MADVPDAEEVPVLQGLSLSGMDCSVIQDFGFGQDFLAGMPAALARVFARAQSFVIFRCEKLSSLDSSTDMKLGQPESLPLRCKLISGESSKL